MTNESLSVSCSIVYYNIISRVSAQVVRRASLSAQSWGVQAVAKRGCSSVPRDCWYQVMAIRLQRIDRSCQPKKRRDKQVVGSPLKMSGERGAGARHRNTTGEDSESRPNAPKKQKTECFYKCPSDYVHPVADLDLKGQAATVFVATNWRRCLHFVHTHANISQITRKHQEAPSHPRTSQIGLQT